MICKRLLSFAPALALLSNLPGQAMAHGSMEYPISRAYFCKRHDNPERPQHEACQHLVSQDKGTQPVHNWMSIRQADTQGGLHQQLIADGKLCGAADPVYNGLNDGNIAWPRTPLPVKASSKAPFVYRATAPHATRYFRFYITKDDFDPAKALQWGDLEPAPFCDITKVQLNNGRYQLDCELPKGKTGEHIIYSIWQRSDSGEAFYACSDVVFTDDAPVPATALLPSKSAKAPQTIALNGGQEQPQIKYPHKHQSKPNTGRGNHDPVLKPVEQLKQAESATQEVKPAASTTNQKPGKPVKSLKARMADKHPDADYVYPDGMGTYKAGTVVQAEDGALYQCKPFPYTGWCNVGPLHYAPATGLNWTDAWDKVQ